MHSFKKREQNQKDKKINAFKHVFSFIKFTKFHAFIYAFFKNKKKSIKLHAFVYACFQKRTKSKFIFKQISFILTCIRQKNQISRIHKCILQKEQNQKFIFKQISCILICILQKNQISCIHKYILHKEQNKKRNFHALSCIQHTSCNKKNQTSCKSIEDIIR